MKRKVKVDLGELAIALDTDFSELQQYLDLETGRIVPIMEEIDRDLDEIYDEIFDEDGNRQVSLEDYLQQRDDPDWQKEMMLDADRVEQGYGTRYIRVERDDPYDDYRAMELCWLLNSSTRVSCAETAEICYHAVQSTIHLESITA